MYTFKPYTERVGRLRDAVRDRLIIADAVKARLQLEALKKYIKYPPLLQKPYISLYVLERMPLNIQEDEEHRDAGCRSHKRVISYKQLKQSSDERS